MKKTVGILGGMGPLATADLFRKIITHTRAETDQEHIPVLIDSNTAIPDRTAALLYGGADPMPEMIRSAKRLEAAARTCWSCRATRRTAIWTAWRARSASRSST